MACECGLINRPLPGSSKIKEAVRASPPTLYDGVWEGDPAPHLPRVPHPSAVIKRWQSGEGTNYLDEETNAATKGKYPNPARLWEEEQYPIGNGRLAASVFHGSGRDRYSLNEFSFWSGGLNPGTINDKGDKTLRRRAWTSSWRRRLWWLPAGRRSDRRFQRPG